MVEIVGLVVVIELLEAFEVYVEVIEFSRIMSRGLRQANGVVFEMDKRFILDDVPDTFVEVVE